MKLIRILVTGAGSGVGQGIMKALHLSRLPVSIISSDINSMQSGLFRSDESVVLPRVEDKNALGEIVEKIIDLSIDVIMIGSEFDLVFFSTHRKYIQEKTGAFVVASDLETIRICEDKWKTVKFLEQHGLPHSPSKVPDSLEQAFDIAETWKYPFILKTRIGCSGRDVHIIENQEQLATLWDTIPKPMMQKMIERPSADLRHEYTCSVFKCRDGKLLGPFTAKRTLKAGNSWMIEVAPFETLYPLLLRIGEALPVLGSINIQLMTGPRGPVPFEFNARFSGTTAVRAHFGFNEPEMVLKNYYLNQELSPPTISQGLTFRYLEEVFVDNASQADAAAFFTKGKVRSWF